MKFPSPDEQGESGLERSHHVSEEVSSGSTMTGSRPNLAMLMELRDFASWG